MASSATKVAQGPATAGGSGKTTRRHPSTNLGNASAIFSAHTRPAAGVFFKGGISTTAKAVGGMPTPTGGRSAGAAAGPGGEPRIP